MRLIFYIILFGVAYLVYHLYGKKLLKKKPSEFLKPLLILLGILLVLAVITGRASAIFALIGGLIASAFRFAPIVLKFYPQIRELLYKFGIDAPAGPGSSKVRTATLAATVDSLSGRIDGEIIAGPYKGQRLSSMAIEDVKAYYLGCVEQDPQALRLVEAFVMREHPDQIQSGEWNESQHHSGESGPTTSDTSMSVAEAREILGVNDTASKQEITYAHRKLMARLHPDKGGSTFLATRVNLAKDTLLANINTHT